MIEVHAVATVLAELPDGKGIAELVAIGDPAIPALVAVLAEPGTSPRAQAIGIVVLAQIRSAAARLALEQILSATRIRCCVVAGLAAFGERVLPILTTALEDPNAGVRAVANDAHVSIGGPEVTRALGNLLSSRTVSRSTVRREAADALGRIGDFDSVIALWVACVGIPSGPRIAAARTLVQVVSVLQTEDPDSVLASPAGYFGRALYVPPLAADPIAAALAFTLALHDAVGAASAVRGVWHVLARSKPVAAAQSLEALLRKDHHTAAEVLNQMGASVLPVLFSMLRNGSAVRGTAVNAVAQHGLSAVPELVKALNDEHPGVREAATTGLGQVHGRMLAKQAHVVRGLATLRGDPDPSVRLAANETLSHAGAAVAAILIDDLDDPDATVRRIAAGALCALELDGIDDADIDVLVIAALRDPAWPVREAASQALRRIGAPAVPTLVDSLINSTAADRRRSAHLLGALGRAATDAVRPLTDALTDADEGVRQAAVSALGRLGVDSSFRVAMEKMISALEDSSDRVRQAAAQALSGTDAPQAAPSLISLLNDAVEGVRRAAEEALGRLGDRAAPELTEALGAPSERVRRSAVRALWWMAATKTDVAVAVSLLKMAPPESRDAADRALSTLAHS